MADLTEIRAPAEADDPLSGTTPLGYAALIAHYKLRCPPPRRLLATASGRHRSMLRVNGVEWLLLPRSSGLRVPDTPIQHLGVALKHEGVDLRVLAALFRQAARPDIVAFILANPRGQYVRRAWFFYEWLTGDTLPIDPLQTMEYVPALDPTRYFTRFPTRSARHRVNDNMPGVPAFCPLIRRTDRLSGQHTQALATEARHVVDTADPAVLRRAVAYMVLNESKGSFEIEGEVPSGNRLERWGQVISAAATLDLTIDTLESLQRSLFDRQQRFVRLGLRTRGGFVGRHDRHTASPIPDHVSARPEDLRSLLGGLLETYAVQTASGFDPILAAAVLGFGFVFIHPFEDGNGRLHRLLFQKALMDGGFGPRGVVLPISSAILDDLAQYRAVLEDFSLPALGAVEWDATPDGNVTVTNDTADLYRYFDATRQAEYLMDCIERTIRSALPNELRYLHQFDDAKRRIADLADMPDRLSSLFIQFCNQNAGHLSAGKRADYFPGMEDGLLARLEAAVQASFA